MNGSASFQKIQPEIFQYTRDEHKQLSQKSQCIRCAGLVLLPRDKHNTVIELETCPLCGAKA